MTLYRDPLTGLQGQVASKRGLLAEQAALVSPVLRALAEPSLRRRLARVPAGDAPLPSTVEALSELDDALDDALAAFDEVRCASARLRRCPHDVEPFPRPVTLPPWLIEELKQLGVRRRFTAEIAAIAAEADIVRWGDRAYVARFTLRGSPVAVRLLVEETTHRLAVRTSVPEAMPLVRVRGERTTDAIAKVLGLRRELDTGADALDDAFWIEGDADAATALTASAGAALLELGPLRPELAFGLAVAEVRWATSGPPLLPLAALDVVLGIREAVEGA